MASTASGEWRRYGMVPIAAALGYAASVIHIYGLGPFIVPISQEFGWSRTEVTMGLTISTLVQAVMSIPIGLMVDRVGPRLLGVLGVLLTAGAFALIGTATGGQGNWIALWLLMAAATLPVQATVWTSAVASRFTASRGMALAVTLCGASVATSLFPWLGTVLIASQGWRRALAYEALIWIVIAFPLIFLFFRGARDGKPDGAEVAAVQPRDLAGVTFREGLRSPVYLRLLVASLLFTFTILGLVVHFVPILTTGGIGKMQAAGIAALIGLSSLAGRLGTGVMLDRFPASLVGAGVFLLPVLGSLTLILTGTSSGGAAVAALLVGLTLGAEVDVIVYLTTRHFGLKSVGALYGGLLAALSIGTATGPLGASRIFDLTGGYTPFLWLTIGMMAASSLLLATLPRPQEPTFHGH